MALEIRDETGKIKTWVWIAAGIVGIILFFLISRLGGSGASSSGGYPAPDVVSGQSSDITDYLDQLNQSLLDIAGNSNVPVTNAQPPAPNPTNPQDLQDIIDQLDLGNQVLEQSQQNQLTEQQGLIDTLREQLNMLLTGGFTQDIGDGPVYDPPIDTTPVPPSQPPVSGGTTTTTKTPIYYTVKSGDTLWAIATRFLGSGPQYKTIFNWNRDIIKDPRLIYPGQKLVVGYK